MLKFVAAIIIHMMLLCLYFVFIDTPLSLSLSMWACFSVSVFARGQAMSKLGGVDTSISHDVYLLLLILFLCIIMLFGVILIPFLS